MDVSDVEFTFVDGFINDSTDDKFIDIFRNLSEVMSSLEVNPSQAPELKSEDDSDDKSTSCRKLPPRQAKENVLHRCKRRVIAKPKHKDRMHMSPDFIRKLYIENKPRNFRPSSLETIYEEPIAVNNEVKFIGGKKLKRSLSCCDGINISKTTKKVRKLRIKQAFGRKTIHKKISLEEFIAKLNANLQACETDSDNSENLANRKNTISSPAQEVPPTQE